MVVLPPEVLISAVALGTVKKRNAYMAKWLESINEDTAPADTCMSCLDAEPDCNCDDYAPQSIADKLHKLAPATRADVIYQYEADSTCCEDCTLAYTDECPAIAARVANIFNHIGDYDIEVHLSHDGAKERLVRNLSKKAYPITLCQEFDPDIHLSEDWDETPSIGPVTAVEVLDMDGFEMEEVPDLIPYI